MTVGQQPIRFEANTLVVPADPSQAGFDSLIFGFYGDNRKAHAYNEVKVAIPKTQSLSEIVATKLVGVLDYHFNKIIISTTDQFLEVDEFKKRILQLVCVLVGDC